MSVITSLTDSSSWIWILYILNHADLYRHGICTIQEAKRHFERYGKTEKRWCLLSSPSLFLSKTLGPEDSIWYSFAQSHFSVSSLPYSILLESSTWYSCLQTSLPIVFHFHSFQWTKDIVHHFRSYIDVNTCIPWIFTSSYVSENMESESFFREYLFSSCSVPWIWLQIPNRGMDIGAKFCALGYLKDVLSDMYPNDDIWVQMPKWWGSFHTKSDPILRKFYLDPFFQSPQSFHKIVNVLTSFLQTSSSNVMFLGPHRCHHYYTHQPQYKQFILPHLDLLQERFPTWSRWEWKNTNNSSFRFCEGNCFIMHQTMYKDIFLTNPTFHYSCLLPPTSYYPCPHFLFHYFQRRWNIPCEKISRSVWSFFCHHPQKFFPSLLYRHQYDTFHHPDEQERDFMVEHIYERMYLEWCVENHASYLFF